MTVEVPGLPGPPTNFRLKLRLKSRTCVFVSLHQVLSTSNKFIGSIDQDLMEGDDPGRNWAPNNRGLRPCDNRKEDESWRSGNCKLSR